MTTYQTIEHVQDPCKVVAEMLRITRPGGGILISCPDYRSTFEPHYLLPWLPLLPRFLARAYLRFLRRPTTGFDNLQYTTKPKVMKWIKKAGTECGAELSVLDIDKQSFHEALHRKGLPRLPGSFFTYRAFLFIRHLFTRELNVNLFVKVMCK